MATVLRKDHLFLARLSTRFSTSSGPGEGGPIHKLLQSNTMRDQMSRQGDKACKAISRFDDQMNIGLDEESIVQDVPGKQGHGYTAGGDLTSLAQTG